MPFRPIAAPTVTLTGALTVVVAVLGGAPTALAQDEPRDRGRIRWAEPRERERERPLEVLPPRRSEPEADDDEPPATEDAEPPAAAAIDVPPAPQSPETVAEPAPAPTALDRPLDALPPPAAAEEAAIAEALPPPLEWEEGPTVPAREVVTASPRTLVGDHLGVWLDVGLGAGGSEAESAFAFSTELGIRYQVSDAIVADVSWGLTYGDTSVSGEGILGGAPVPFEGEVERVQSGNPTLSAAFSHAFDDDARLEVGLGLAVPAAARADAGSDSEGLAERRGSLVTHRAALAMRGYWSPWRWFPERVGLFLPARVVAPIDALVLEGEVGVGVMIPVLGDRGADSDLVVQAMFGAGGQVAGPFHLGARVRVVGAAVGLLGPIDEIDAVRDDVVFSAEPWARLRFDPVQVSARVSLNLNGVDGVAGQRGPAFGTFVAVGVEL